MGAAEKIWNATEVAGTHSSDIPSSSRAIDHSLSLPEMKPRIVSVFLALPCIYVFLCCIRFGMSSTRRELFRDLFKQWSNLDESDFSLETVSGGITNLLLKVSVREKDGNSVSTTVRLYGPNTEYVIDHRRELQAIPYLSATGFGAKLLGVFGNGMVQSFIDARTLTPSDMRKPELVVEIAKQLRRFHEVEIPGSKEPQLWNDISKFFSRDNFWVGFNLEYLGFSQFGIFLSRLPQFCHGALDRSCPFAVCPFAAATSAVATALNRAPSGSRSHWIGVVSNADFLKISLPLLDRHGSTAAVSVSSNCCPATKTSGIADAAPTAAPPPTSFTFVLTVCLASPFFIFIIVHAALTLKFDESEKQKKYEMVSFEEINQEINGLKEMTDRFDAPVVYCHNDLLSGNLMLNDNDGKLYFIDFEYGSYNYRGFDIGNHFNEYAGYDCDYNLYPRQDEQFFFFRNYLSPDRPHEVSKEAISALYAETNLYMLASHLYWALWALIQAKMSPIDFDYLSYFFLCYNEYKKQKEKCFSLAHSYFQSR
ncbi:hypothetical protein SASPL_155127 [Salvia splendens]|uniref:ethanolamine kinase n=1 Tax=Salvia splendens TaxID=180675 RepID=A0A8X8W146_SALSN|nr:hypothetical protein SASPL_155127 [Salvia splendens]